MVASSFGFSFRVRLPASADRAYRWATDYGPEDLAMMGETGRRSVEKLSADALLLTDDVVQDGRRVRKVRLVRLLPEKRSWTNTHLSGPIRHSQFLYEITPISRHASRLEFTGLQVEHGPRALTAAQRARRAREVRAKDRKAWTRLVRAMRRELGRKP